MKRMMKKKVRNLTRNSILAWQSAECRSILSKATGLMFSRKSSLHSGALIFPFESLGVRSIHMFFVFYPIDLLFLDGKHKVVEIRRRIGPFRIHNPCALSKYVVELEAGAVDMSKTRIGDEISWE